MPENKLIALTKAEQHAGMTDAERQPRELEEAWGDEKNGGREDDWEMNRSRGLFFEASRDAITVTNRKGEIIDVNPAALDLFGVSRDGLVGRNFLDFYVDSDSGRQFVKEIESAGSVQDFEAKLHGPRGKQMDCLLTVAFRKSQSGVPIGYQGVIRDVTVKKRALTLLRESEERFRSLCENAPDIIYTLAESGSFSYVNPAWERFLGHRPDEVIGKFFTDFCRPQEADMFSALLKRIKKEPRVFSDVDAELLARDGSVKFFSLSGHPNIDADGKIVGIIGVLRDITARRVAEHDLKIQTALLEQVIRNAPEAIVILDIDDRVITINPEFTRLFGFTMAEARGRLVNDLIVPKEKKDEGAIFTLKAGGGARISSETKRVRKDGSLVDVWVMGAPLKFEGGQFGVLGIYRDISERKKSEQAVRQSERRFRDMADLLPTIITEVGDDFCVKYANTMGLQVFGVSREDLRQGVNILDLIHPADRKLGREQLETALQGVRTGPLEVRLVRQSGPDINALVASAPIFDENRIVGLRLSVQDITVRKEQEKALRESEEKYRTILENIEEGYYEIDLAGNFTFATDVASHIVGLAKNQFLGKNFAEFCDTKNAETLWQAYHDVFMTGKPNKQVNYLVTLADSTVKVLEASAGLVRDEKGEPIGFRGIIRDMTARKAAEEALRDSEDRHRTVLEAAPDPVVVKDVEGKVTYLNPAFTRVFGWTMEECQGLHLDHVPVENRVDDETLGRKIDNGESFSGIETCRLTKDGRMVEVSISGAVFFDAQGRPKGSVITLQDITERKKAEKELRFVAFHDQLTGLPNRKSFYMRLEDSLIQASRRGKDNTWALMFLDLDRFKNINDTLGHDAGDILLKSVAVRINSCLRKSDHFFRLGGDEFTIILNNLAKDIDVARVARKIREQVSQPFSIKGHELHISVSIGISVYPNDGIDVETLVKNADMAMYAAKEEGDGYRFFTEEMNRKALDRMKLEGSLRSALNEKQFVLFYQPLVDDAKRVVGMEALLRWQHPELGLIPPAQFIPLAEETGAILPIGEWVLTTACRQAKQWHEMGFDELYVAVNLSARQFTQADLVERVKDVLGVTGLPAGSLKLEVTESCVMEDPEEAILKMNSLRETGIRFSIDDFGTGYSSLSYLKRLPIDTLKIDRSFVCDAVDSKDDQEIIKTIVSMARNLRIDTVAEGVETLEQQDFLCRNGCRMMQGYLFGRPMPVREFEKAILNLAGEEGGRRRT
ncbi:MAG: PAS domain S-box protein [Pseudomonadota bacterium]